MLLKERYDEASKLVDAHMKALIGISSPANTLVALQQFHDSVEGHVRSLQSLGTPPEQYESMLVPMLQSKLSPGTLRNLARANGTEQWTLTSHRRQFYRRYVFFSWEQIPLHTTSTTPHLLLHSWLVLIGNPPKHSRILRNNPAVYFVKDHMQQLHVMQSKTHRNA